MVQKSLGDFISPKEKVLTPDLPPTYPPGFKFDCSTCFNNCGQTESLGFTFTRCYCQLMNYEKDCRGRYWHDKDPEKRFWIPKPLLRPDEVKKYCTRDERRKHLEPGIPDENLEGSDDTIQGNAKSGAD